jgi:putative tryptophan/tyrosine transport system substrate-binding protein
MAIHIRRREFIAGLGSAAAWPLVARAQQTMPVVGFIWMRSARSAEDFESFIRGLNDVGFVDHRNVVIDRRDVTSYDQLPAIAIDLVRNKVTAICAPFDAIEAVAKTSATPMVFIGATDPVAAGLVASLNRPGRNVTGVRLSAGALPEKQIELLHELVPAATKVGLLVNPEFANAEQDATAALKAGDTLGIKVIVERVTAESEFEAVFIHFVREGVGALQVIGNLFFRSHRDRLAALAIRERLPMIGPSRDYAVAGDIMSYGPDTRDVVRQAGKYVGRILKGEKPADLPVLQPTKFDLVINLKTAKALGLEIPPALLATADEVIE